MKVCLVGGEDVHFREAFATRLQRTGINVLLLGSCTPTTCRVGRLVEHLHYDLSRRFSPHTDLRSILQLTEAIRSFQPDVVHAFDTKPGILAPLASKLAGGTAVSVRTVTGLGSMFTDGGVRRRLYCFAQQRLRDRCDLTVFQNRDDRSLFVKERLVVPERAKLIFGSGVDVENLRSTGTPQARKVVRSELKTGERVMVLMLSRLARSKGVMEFIHAASEARKRHAHLQFVIAGPRDADARDALTDVELDYLHSEVSYLGYRTDVPALLAASDIVVLPSYREGMPRVLLEAQALSRAVIATDVPGCRDVVKDGTTGLLVTARDVASLAEAIVKLSLDEPLRQRLGVTGYEHVLANFDLSAVVREYLDIYGTLLSRSQTQ